jgi:DNA-binding winged helix-turn-helix (wHTH) protein/Tol biopolymer transport system component
MLPLTSSGVWMESPAVSQRNYRFGSFELFADRAELRKDGARLKLQGQPFQILLILLEAQGDVVTRDALRAALWPADTFVDFDHSLNTAVKKLRQALSDTAESPQFIETIPRVGYRFLQDVRQAQHGPSSEPSSSVEVAIAAPVRKPGWSLVKAEIFIAVAVVVVVSSVLLIHAALKPATLRITGTRQLTFGNGIFSIESDGKRLYFVRAFDSHIYSVPVGGGAESSFGTQFKQPIILHISPDGSTLLVRECVWSSGYMDRVWLLPTNGGPGRPLGDIEAEAAAWSPDGGEITFTQRNRIFLTDQNGTASRRLLEARDEVTWIRWSPDGKHLRFSTIDAKSSVPSMWEANRAGNFTTLPIKSIASVHGCCGFWTRDGEHFIFEQFRDQRYDLWVASEHPPLFVSAKPFPLDSAGPEIVSATASPIDDQLFVVGQEAKFSTFKYEPARRMLTPFLPDRSIGNPEFSPDRHTMLYVGLNGEESVLYRAKADGSTPVPLTDPALDTLLAQFSRDGRRIAFMAKWEDQPWQVFWMLADGGAPHPLKTSVLSQADPNWMPDNQSILFGQTPWYLADPDAPRALYIENIETGALQKIPGSDGWFSPRLSPDGTKFVAISTDEKRLALYDFASARWSELLNSESARLAAPFWSEDGKSVFLNMHERSVSVESNASLARIFIANHTTETVVRFQDFIPNQACNAWSSTPEGYPLISCWEPNANIYALQYTIQ